MRTAEIREKFLSFFEGKGHLRLPSFSLIPEDDPSLLFTSAGMAPLKPYFLGAKPIFGGREWRRVTTCQECLRVGDIENVGRTSRHNTYFEMLGNFSFGDYFKKEAILWAWEFLTEHLKLDPGRLWVTVFEDDDEAYEIWRDLVGVPEERIGRFGEDENYWPGGAITHGPNGPSGPCSEIFYDRGPAYGTPDETGPNTGSGDRFVEIWNLVFTQYDRQGPIPGPGILKPLPQKNIDTGMGLYRVAAILQDVEDFYRTDTFFPIIQEVARMSGRPYEGKTSVSHRVIADHVRAVVAALSDGATFSNTGRGYVIRRLLRRALRHGYLLGLSDPFLHRLAPLVAELLGDFYPEMRENLPAVEKQIRLEEERFLETLEGGLKRLDALLSGLKPGEVLPGKEAFRLYDTYGFPLDLTREILEEKGYGVDEDGFAAAMKEQKDKARNARKTTNYMGADVTVYQSIDPAITTEFVGYNNLTAESKITILTTEDEIVEALTDGQRGTVITEQTPFYGTMGGQQGDVGVITGQNGEFKVEDTIHLQGGKVGHVGVMTHGMLQNGNTVTLSVCARNRALTCQNHSATHLLQKALRLVLGEHVKQSGSYVDAGRLRFDFTHFSAMTPEELGKVEELVNQEIRAGLPVETQVMTLDEAKKTGAMALFGEKYGDSVRVVKMGDFSTELCGGTHVANTGSIASFKILSETGIAAGVRRIEALTSEGLMKHYEEVEKELHEAAKTAKTTPAGLSAKIEALLEEIKALSAENEKLKSKLAKDSLGDVMNQVKEVNGVKVLASQVADVDMNGLRGLGDQLKDRLGEGVVLIASVMDGKVNLMATATDGAQKKGAHAGNLIKAIAGLVGGGGGGRPGMAQAGGKNPAGVEEALKKAVEVVEEQTK